MARWRRGNSETHPTDNPGMQISGRRLALPIPVAPIPTTDSRETKPALRRQAGAAPQTDPATAPEANRRFATQQRPSSTSPRLRVRRMLGRTAKGLLGRWDITRPTTVAEITVTPKELVRALLRVAPDHQALLSQGVLPIHVSDLDGTLWRDPIADVLVYDKLCGEQKLKPAIRDQLSALMGEMGLEPTVTDAPDRGVNRDVLRVKQAFDERKHGYDRTELEHWSRKIYPVTSWALAGYSVEEIQTMTRALVHERGLDGLAFAGAREKIAAMAKQGIPTVLFSASNTVLAQTAVDEIFGTSPRLEVVGTDVRIDARGVLTPEVVGGPCFRELKLGKVKAYLKRHVETRYPEWLGRLDLDAVRPLIASGDSPSKTDEQMMDYAVMACADEPGTVRDVERALARAQENGRFFVLDYLATEGGERADKFRVQDPLRGSLGAL